MRKYYDLLRVNENVEPMALRDATRTLIKEDFKLYEPKSIREVCEAYIILSDNVEKAKYDSVSDEEYSCENNVSIQTKIELLH